KDLLIFITCIVSIIHFFKLSCLAYIYIYLDFFFSSLFSHIIHICCLIHLYILSLSYLLTVFLFLFIVFIVNVHASLFYTLSCLYKSLHMFIALFSFPNVVNCIVLIIFLMFLNISIYFFYGIHFTATLSHLSYNLFQLCLLLSFFFQCFV